MRLKPEYRVFTEDNWRLCVLTERWSGALWRELLAHIEGQPPAKHPQTLKLRVPEGANGDLFFLKVFHGGGGARGLKDIFRQSRAWRALRQGVALSEAGFDVPAPLAAGERRKWRSLQRAFVLTAAISGQSIPAFLRHRYASYGAGFPLAQKRDALRRLAEEVARLHRLGFVHGDLVPSNVFIAQAPEGGLRFFFMDNDRTRRYPPWLVQNLWKRNLVQLNRFPLPGISLQDRVRFFCCYAGSLAAREDIRRSLGWLEMKTRRRRNECDNADATMSFRRLMRWEEAIARDM